LAYRGTVRSSSALLAVSNFLNSNSVIGLRMTTNVFTQPVTEASSNCPCAYVPLALTPTSIFPS
jgi:hypothetical protein